MNALLDLKLDLHLPPRIEGTCVATLILAAGASKRMGEQLKLLLDVGGEPMIHRTVRNVVAFAPVETIVVTGYQAEGIEAALARLPVRFVRNPLYEQGQPTSVAAGVRALTAPCEAVMVVLGDQPMLTPDDMRALIAAYEGLVEHSILVPHHQGERGNPVVFAARHIPDVVSGGINVGCRRLIETDGDAVARPEFVTEAYTTDCDTPEDYHRLLARFDGAPAP